MQIEGGIKAPTPVKVVIKEDDLEWLKGLSAQRDERRGYGRSSDTWRHGIIRDATLVGLVVELATVRFLSKKLAIEIPLDSVDKPRGDGGIDIAVLGAGIQVKGRVKRTEPLFRREKESGEIVSIPWDYCVFGTWERDRSPLDVWLDGWIGAVALRRVGEFKRGRRGDWMNLELDETSLEPMCRLVDRMEVRRLFKEH